MKRKLHLSKLENLIASDQKFSFTLISYATISTIFINLSVTHSPLIGGLTSLVYLSINGTFLGRAFFEKEELFLRFMLGNLLLVVLLGFVGWLTMIIYNLDVTRTAIAIFIVATTASLINRARLRRREYKPPKPKNQSKTPLRFHLVRIIYLFLVGLAFILLCISRSGEVYTVWTAIHPLFLPVFLSSTFVLLTIIFSSEKTQHKLLFAILHSILSHSFMIMIFPAGNVGVQQYILGKTRLVFDNVISNGIGASIPSFLPRLYYLCSGDNFQTAFSVLFARMLSVDVYWVHVPLIPLLWGIFVPLIAFVSSRTLGLNERISVLCALVVSLFPTSIVWGYQSIPNGLSYLFFFCFIYFLLKYLQTNKTKHLILVMAFLVTSTLSHYLAGTVALSLLILSHSVKTYINEKERSPISAKLALSISFIFCLSILPFALAYRRLFYPSANTFFSLNRFRETPLTEIFLPFLLGSYFDLISRDALISALILGVAPLFALIGMVYVFLFKTDNIREKAIYPCILFLSLAFLLVVGNDRIVKFFMIRVPFVEIDRLWVFRDLIIIPFTTLLIAKAISLSEKIFSKLSVFMSSHSKKTINFGCIPVYFLASILLSAWVTMSVYYAYPHYAPLQTTTYEIEAVKYIDQTTQERYIVIADQWIIFAGQMFVGIINPRAFYFSHVDPRGIALFIKMKSNPMNETMKEAMKTNNATTAYFIIEEPRLGTEEYNRIIQQAQQNHLQTYKTFHYEGIEKLHIFYYQRES